MGRSSHVHRMRHAIVMEQQLFSDTLNQRCFLSARLKPGPTYRKIMVYRFSTGR